MKTVSRLTYTFWSLLYHSLCLSGLIWQATQISINFFEFDVNKDINIRMPSGFDFTAGTSIYFCFKMDQFFDQEQFRDLVLVWSKSNETDKRNFVDQWKREGMSRYVSYSFSRWATVGEIFRAVLNESIISQSSIIQILFEDKICFTSSKTNLGSIHFGDEYTKRVNRVLDNVTTISVAIGENHPYFDPQSLIEIDNIRKIVSNLYLRSYSYNIIEKEFPYSDKCYEYRLSKILNRYEAKSKCNEELLGNKFASYHRIISKNDFNFYNLTRSGLGVLDRDCSQQPLDCKRTFHFTSFKMAMWRRDVSYLHVLILPEMGKEPSFTLVSKPRIDNIDYVTHILGALASWLGFSFLGINPVPYLLTVANIAPSNQVEDQSKNSNYIFSLSIRVARNQTKCNESKQELK